MANIEGHYQFVITYLTLYHTRRIKLPKAVERARFEMQIKENEMQIKKEQMKIEQDQKLATLKKQATSTQLVNEDTKDTKEDLSPKSEELPLALPEDIKHHFFASHKKLHSLNLNSTETLARGTVDFLELKYKLKGFFGE